MNTDPEKNPANSKELEQRIREGIPLTAHMDFRVVELTNHAIVVNGGGEKNINVHGTAFAGSLYTICTLALWGLVTSRLPEQADLVLAEGTIRYRKPVSGDIIARCEIAPKQMDHFLNAVQSRGRARLTAEVKVPLQQGPAVEFSGTVYASLEHKGA